MFTRCRIPVFVASALSLAAFAAAHAEAPVKPKVETTLGLLEGEQQPGVRAFRGIPYAAPPVGDLRWAPPQPAARWEGARDATKFGGDCPLPAGMQGPNADARMRSGSNYDIIIAKQLVPGTGEDCLTLNVWAPDPPRKDAPVIVFFSPTGSGALPFFDGAAFARDGVVFVSANNRTFTQAMFAHPALTRAALPSKPNSRLQELDRVATLEWVQENARAFGGDPRNVTILGQSNSGAGVLTLIAMPRAKGLFQRAIVQSGSSRGPKPMSHADFERIGVELATMAGLDGANATLEQLRALPIEALPFLAMGSLDEAELDAPVATVFEQGRTNDVALLIGGNDFDGSSLRYGLAAIVERTPADTLAAYAGEGLSGDALGYAIYTDEHVNAPARWYAAAQARRGAPVYLYVYSHVSSFRTNQPGAAHGAELPYVFDSWEKIPALAAMLDETERRVTRIMHDCWIAFARTGKPQCAGVPEWPAYDETTRWTMELDAEPRAHQHYHAAQFAAHDRDHDRAASATYDAQQVIDALRAAK